MHEAAILLLKSNVILESKDNISNLKHSNHSNELQEFIIVNLPMRISQQTAKRFLADDNTFHL